MVVQRLLKALAEDEPLLSLKISPGHDSARYDIFDA